MLQIFTCSVKYSLSIWILYILWISESTDHQKCLRLLFGGKYVWCYSYCVKSNIFDAAVLRQYIWGYLSIQIYLRLLCWGNIFEAAVLKQICLMLLCWGKDIWSYFNNSNIFEAAVVRQICLRLLYWFKYIWSGCVEAIYLRLLSGDKYVWGCCVVADILGATSYIHLIFKCMRS